MFNFLTIWLLFTSTLLPQEGPDNEEPVSAGMMEGMAAREGKRKYDSDSDVDEQVRSLILLLKVIC